MLTHNALQPRLRRSRFVVFATLAAVVLLAGITVGADSAAKDPVPFTDVKAQTLQFIEYHESIKLTPEQEAIKKEALTAMPAPCCSNNTAYTCCCPCNMSRSVWGLSHLLITQYGYNAEQVRAKVKDWIQFINPDGYSGDVCATGGCGRPFAKNGCGGMRKGEVSWVE
jgi:hypothetical protein